MFNPLQHPQCFSMVHRLSPSTWTGHIPFGMFLTGLLKPHIIVELGTFYGTSYCALCQTVQELELDTRCYAIDSWVGDSQSGFYGEDILDDLKRYHDPLYGGFSRLIRSSFEEALKHFTDQTIDLLHIDGFHTYEAVKQDFVSWLPKMSEQGVILFHDINVRERDFGVWKFWEEVRTQHPYFEFAHSHGLGVLAVGKNIPVEFSEFLAFSANNRIQITNFFYQQGQRLENLQELQLVRETASRQKEIIKGLQENERKFAEQQARNAEILIDREKRITHFESKLREMETQNPRVDELEKEAEAKRKQFADLERKLQENEAQNLNVAQLKQELEIKKEQLAKELQMTSGKVVELEEKENFLNQLGQRLVVKSQRLSAIDPELQQALHKINDFSLTDKNVVTEFNEKNGRKGNSLSLILGVVTFNNSAEQILQLLKSIELAAEKLNNLPIEIKIFVLDNAQESHWRKSVVPIVRFASEGNVGFGNGMNRLMAAAFSDSQTRWFLCVNPDGTLHRNALKELIKMSNEHPDSLIEARQFPEEHTKEYDSDTFETAWASGACLLIGQDIFKTIGGFDPNFFMYLEDVDLSWRARSAGLSVKIAPQAIFGHAVLNRDFSVVSDKNMLLSGRYLAAKWQNTEFVNWAEQELVARKYYQSPSELPKLPHIYPSSESINPQISNFEHYFNFSMARW